MRRLIATGRRPRCLAQASLRFLALVLLAGAWACAPEPQRVAIGRPLPAFELPRLGGGSFASEELKGVGPVILNFWATWCGPCEREIPVLQELHASGEVRVVSINIDTTDETLVRDFIRRHGIEYEVLQGGISTLSRYGSHSIPYTLVLDRDLTVRALHRSVVSRSTLERDVSAAAR